MENQPNPLSNKKTYQSPELKDFGNVSNITNTSNLGAGSVDDGGGIAFYTS
jgi:hypothetical protein